VKPDVAILPAELVTSRSGKPLGLVERVTESALAYYFRTAVDGRFPGWGWRTRPVFCPKCRTHFTTMIPPAPYPVAATCVHYVCADCGGDGTPASLEAPR
jgi:hypothetical protein